MLENTWIGVTGQLWKLYVSLVLMTATIASIAAAWAYIEREDIFIVGILSFVALGLVWLGWTFFSFRCPTCSSPVVWKVLRLLPHEESIQVAFFVLTNCPTCNHAFFDPARARSTL